MSGTFDKLFQTWKSFVVFWRKLCIYMLFIMTLCLYISEFLYVMISSLIYIV